jgi:hypothetical protein
MDESNSELQSEVQVLRHKLDMEIQRRKNAELLLRQHQKEVV